MMQPVRLTQLEGEEEETDAFNQVLTHTLETSTAEVWHGVISTVSRERRRTMFRTWQGKFDPTE